MIHKRRVHTPISQINGRLHNTFYMFFVRRPAGPVCVGFCVFCPKVLVCCIILVEWSEVRPMQCLTVTLCYTVTLFCKSMLPRLSAKSRLWQKFPLIAAECQLLLMSTMIMTKLSFESNSVKLHCAIVWKRVQCSGSVVASTDSVASGSQLPDGVWRGCQPSTLELAFLRLRLRQLPYFC